MKQVYVLIGLIGIAIGMIIFIGNSQIQLKQRKYIAFKEVSGSDISYDTWYVLSDAEKSAIILRSEK